MSLSKSDTPPPSSKAARSTPARPCDATPPGLAQVNNPDQPQRVRHNLGNTLYSILLHAQCAKLNIDQSDLKAAHQNLDDIQRAVQNAGQVVDAFLAEHQPPANDVSPPATQNPAAADPAKATSK